VGARVEKRRGQGVFGQMAISFLSNRTEVGEGIDRAVGPAGAGDCRRPGVGGGRG
jgi:hypothetical protein